MPFFHQGFLRVACAVPVVKIADPDRNADQIIGLLKQAEAEDAALVVFPELCLTGYTCGDMFHHQRLLDRASAGLDRVRDFTKSSFGGVAVVGLPLAAEGQLFNVAAVLHHGRVLAVVPKTYLPNYREFYEARWFSSGRKAGVETLALGDELAVMASEGVVPVARPNFTLGVEICEDLWVPQPPSARQALAGAMVLCNLSASNDLTGKAAYRRELVTSQSGRCIAGYVYSSCGAGESSTDVVFGGHCLIAENGMLLAESKRFGREPTLLVADLDLERLAHDRMKQGSFSDGRLAVPDPGEGCAAIASRWTAKELAPRDLRLRRFIDPHPFVLKNDSPVL